MIKVTVVVPVYNISSAVLRKCVLSLINQSMSDIEIIMIDDGSDINCARLCDELGQSDDRISVIHKENGGVSTCRNYGIENAKGEWIAFVDADDWVEPEYLQKLVNMGLKTGADIVICDCIIEYGHKSVRNSFFREQMLDSDVTGKDRFVLQFLCSRICKDGHCATDSGAPWAKIYKKNFLTRNHLKYQETLRRMQDNVFNLDAYECASKIFYFNEPLYHYRKSSDSGFHRYNPCIKDNYIQVFQYIENYIDKYHKGNEFRKALDYKVIFSMYVILKNDFCHADNPMSYREQQRKLNSILSNQYYVHAIRNVDKKLLGLPEKGMLILMKIQSVSLLKASIYCKNIVFKFMGRGI